MSLADAANNANHNYRVTIFERARSSNRITCLLGDGVPTPSAGGGGYNPITLPMRSAVVEWQGRPDLQLVDVPIRVIDEMGGIPLAAQTKRLTNMWRPANASIPPPVVKLRCAHDLIPYSHLPMVINDLQWGDAQANENGYRIMQDFTVQFMEYRADEQLQAIQVKQQTDPLAATTYVVKKGDTLSSIAKKFDMNWRTLGQAQHPPITDPRKIHVGERLSIPPGVPGAVGLAGGVVGRGLAQSGSGGPPRTI